MFSVCVYILDIRLTFFYYVLVVLLGFLVAFAELLSRSSEGASEIFKALPAYIYFLINGMASALSYWLITDSHILPDQTGLPEAMKIILAGFSAMAILRSSFGSVKVGGVVYEAGIAPIVQVFLIAAERAFDRKRSRIDLQDLSTIMENVDFAKANKDLPTLCVMSLQNLPASEQKRIGNEVSELSQAGLKFNKTKSLALGRIIAYYTGKSLLKEAVTALSDRISITDRKSLNAAEDASEKELAEMIKKLEQKP
jgi:hypothetical protein